MEEQEFKDFYEILNERPCSFEKSLLTGRCACEQAQRLNIAEREAMACAQRAAQRRCAELLEHLHHNARFALKLPHAGHTLPHAKEMQVQCGGLLGLQSALLPEQAGAQVQNVYALLDQAVAAFGGLDGFPYGEIVKSIVHYQARRRGARG